MRSLGRGGSQSCLAGTCSVVVAGLTPQSVQIWAAMTFPLELLKFAYELLALEANDVERQCVISRISLNRIAKHRRAASLNS